MSDNNTLSGALREQIDRLIEAARNAEASAANACSKSEVTQSEHWLREARAELEAALAAQPEVGGEWVLVPREPTGKMTFVGQSMRYESANSIGTIYAAMIAAAPTPAAVEVCPFCQHVGKHEPGERCPFMDGVGAPWSLEPVTDKAPAGQGEAVANAFERECADVDRILEKLGLGDGRGRTEGGSLKVAFILNHIQETLDALQSATQFGAAMSDQLRVTTRPAAVREVTDYQIDMVRKLASTHTNAELRIALKNLAALARDGVEGGA